MNEKSPAGVRTGAYSKPCGCGGTLEYLGKDRDGFEVWLCRTCDHRESTR